MPPNAPIPAEEAAGPPQLTIGAAAGRLGVAVATLRSWERRYGLGPRPRTAGGHRRYTPEDMARLEYFCRLVGEGVATADAARVALSQPAPSTPPPPPLSPPPHALQDAAAGRGLARCAMRLDQSATLEILEEALTRDGVIGAWQSTIEPALRAVGRKWTESLGRYVEVEHLLSWCITTALHRFHPPPQSPPDPPGRPGRRVLLACSPDEWHSLPLEVLAAALSEHGAPATMLGAAVPAEALAEAVHRTDPAHVVVWSQSHATARPAALPTPPDRARCRILPAGPGWLAARPHLGSVLLSPADALAACLG